MHAPDLKPQNAMLAPPTSHDAITRHLERFPSELYPSHHEESISNDPIITAKSQPLPALDVSADGSNISIKVGDFGHCTLRCSLSLSHFRLLTLNLILYS